MIGYKKAVFQGKNGLRTANFERFSLFGEGGLTATESLNCDCRGGALRRGIGFLPHTNRNGSLMVASLDEEIAGVYMLSVNQSMGEDSDAVVLVGENGYAYSLDTSLGAATARVLLGTHPSHCALRLNDKKITHLFSGSQGMYLTEDGISFTAIVLGDVRGICAAGGRFFVAEGRNKVLYSSPYLPKQWFGFADQGGQLYLPAAGEELVGIQAEGRNVYLFGKRAVFRVQVKAKATTFEVERLGYEGGNICPYSFVATGHGVLFLADDGVYRLRGESAEKLSLDLSVLPKQNGACYTAKCGDTALIDYEDEGGVWRRIALSVDGKNAFFADRTGRLGGNEYFFVQGGVNRFVRGGTSVNYATVPYFETGWLRFGSAKRKTLKKIRIKGQGNVTLRILTEGAENSYTVFCTQGEGEVTVCDSGQAFAFRFCPATGGVVEGMTVEYLCYDE